MAAVSFRSTKSEWADAGRKLKGVAPSEADAKVAPAAIEAQNDKARFWVEGAKIGLSAVVASPGKVVLPYPLLLSLVKYVASLREKDVVFEADMEKITLTGGMVFEGENIRIVGLDIRPIELGVGPKVIEILCLPHRYSDEEIAASGYGDRVRDAEEKARQLIKQAAELLEPMGVDEDDVSKVVQVSVREAAKRPLR